MTIERAIEILDPEHRESYDSLETVNEACRMGMAALEKSKDRRLAEVVRCKDCAFAKNAKWNKKGYRICPASHMEITDDDFCSYGVREDEHGHR